MKTFKEKILDALTYARKNANDPRSQAAAIHALSDVAEWMLNELASTVDLERMVIESEDTETIDLDAERGPRK